MSTTLARVLTIMGYEDEEIAVATKTIGLMQRVLMIRRDTLLMNSMEKGWGQRCPDRGGFHRRSVD
eukprot:9332616-Ditylum_brightwellii.AAC.1